MVAPNFDAMVERSHNALLEIARGNAGPFKEMFSDGEDVSLANPFGGVARGHAQVWEMLEGAASHYRDGQVVEFETLVTRVADDFAYLVEIERFRARVGDRDELDDVALRVTSIFRRESGQWMLVHRQADTRIGPQPPESVLQ
jgi:ketosteroid isomerase-like protein